MTATSDDANTGPLRDDLSCPLCGYSLRGLTEPRCPECGFAFTWAELLDDRRDRNPILFEHGRGRNVRTFWATYWRAALPRRLWRAVTPANPVHLGRLLIYHAAANAVLVFVVFSSVPGIVIHLATGDLAERADNAAKMALMSSPSRPRGYYVTTFTPAELDDIYPNPWSAGFARQLWRYGDRAGVGPAAAAAAVGLAWPWLSLASLMVFRQSMRRAKVGVPHVLRVVVYGCDSALLLLLVLGGYYALRQWPAVDEWLRDRVRPALLTTESWPAFLAVLTCASAATYRLTVGYARYLRFDRPRLTIPASQAIVLAAALVVFSWSAMSGHY